MPDRALAFGTSAERARIVVHETVDMDEVLFDGLVATAYGQLYMSSASEALPPDPGIAFRGQRNGLCGAAQSGSLFLVLGTHTGEVPVRVTLTSLKPEVGGWDEVVEVSFTPTTGDIVFEGWGGMFRVELRLPITTYRARWSGTDLTAGKRQDVATSGRPAPDKYELTFWPSPVAPDEILRVTSDDARYWHDNGFPRSPLSAVNPVAARTAVRSRVGLAYGSTFRATRARRKVTLRWGWADTLNETSGVRTHLERTDSG